MLAQLIFGHRDGKRKGFCFVGLSFKRWLTGVYSQPVRFFMASREAVCSNLQYLDWMPPPSNLPENQERVGNNSLKASYYYPKVR